MIEFTLSIQVLCGYTCCLQAIMICVKAVRSHPLKFEFLRCCHGKRNKINMLWFNLVAYSVTCQHRSAHWWKQHTGIIFHWHTFFAVGRALAAALLKSCQPKTPSTEITVNMIEAIIKEDRSLTVKELEPCLIGVSLLSRMFYKKIEVEAYVIHLCCTSWW